MQIWLTNHKRQVSLEVSYTKDNQISRSFSQKTRGNMVILHLPLIYVLSSRIAFILGQKSIDKDLE
jgi:hypothetical protein